MKLRIFITTIILLSCTLAYSQKKQAITFNLMSFNIRCQNPNDGVNDWANRKEWVGSLIHFYDIDIVGAQEVKPEQLKDMLSVMHDYGYIGVGREDGKEKGEYSAIFYRKDKYKVLKSATFWLSETPDVPGKGWDAAYERVVSWAKFADVKTGKEFFVFNTHFDHMGEIARKQSAILLRAKVHEIAGKEPAMITGDFNASPQTGVYSTLTNGDNAFIDTQSLASFKYGPEWTFHGFGTVPDSSREKIDYIFVNDPARFKIYRSAIIAEQRGNIYPSDHCQLFVKVEVK